MKNNFKMSDKRALLIKSQEKTSKEIILYEAIEQMVYDLIGHEEVHSLETLMGTFMYHPYKEKEAFYQPFFYCLLSSLTDFRMGELFFGNVIFIPADETINLKEFSEDINFCCPCSEDIAKKAKDEKIYFVMYDHGDIPYPAKTNFESDFDFNEFETMRLLKIEYGIKEVLNNNWSAKKTMKEIKSILKENVFHEESYYHLHYEYEEYNEDQE